MKKLRSKKVAYKWGAFSWVHRTRFDNQWSIAVQYLRYQGAEFHILFDSKQQADSLLKSLFHSFNKNKDAPVVNRYGWSEKDYQFDVENCLCPVKMLLFARESFPSARLVLTPTTYHIKEFFFGEKSAGVNEHLIFRNESDLANRYSFYEYNEALALLIA